MRGDMRQGQPVREQEVTATHTMPEPSFLMTSQERVASSRASVKENVPLFPIMKISRSSRMYAFTTSPVTHSASHHFPVALRTVARAKKGLPQGGSEGTSTS